MRTRIARDTQHRPASPRMLKDLVMKTGRIVPKVDKVNESLHRRIHGRPKHIGRTKLHKFFHGPFTAMRTTNTHELQWRLGWGP